MSGGDWFARAQATRAAAHPIDVQLYSTRSGQWRFVNEAKNEQDAERIIAMCRVLNPGGEYRALRRDR